MVTNCHTTDNIRKCLQFMREQITKSRKNTQWPLFEHMVTDFSRALLNAISLAFNDVTLITYINITHNWLNNEHISTVPNYVRAYPRIHGCMLRTSNEQFQTSD